MRARRLACLAALLWVFGRPTLASAQAVTATVSIPAGVSFVVPDVSQSAAGGRARSGCLLHDGHQGLADFYVSVKADTASFAGPGTTHIPASKVSWTATTSSGTASNGTLSSTAYSQLFRSVREILRVRVQSTSPGCSDRSPRPGCDLAHTR